MTRKPSLFVARHEQPDEAVWTRIDEFARRWNSGRNTHFLNIAGIAWKIAFDDERNPEFKLLMDSLNDLKAAGLKWNLAFQWQYDEADFSRADFVCILGVGLGGDRPADFLPNAVKVLGEPQPCPVCGYADDHSRPQLGTFSIAERFLDLPVDRNEPAPPGGWDVVNLPHGHLVVSRRIVDLLQRAGVRGYETLPVLSAETGQPSARAVQLLAKRAIPQPCLVHTRITGTGVCPHCGVFYGELESLMHFRQDLLDGDEIFSRNPGRGAELYVSQRIRQLLRDLPANGVTPFQPAMLCRH